MERRATPLDGLIDRHDFHRRHIGVGATADDDSLRDMLSTIGVDSLAELIDRTVPASIRMTTDLALPDELTETEVLTALREIARRNRPRRSLIGMGYVGTITPPVIRRNVLENPAWYTSYTPYQPEISQGRLEALLNFQTMVADLTGLPVANASLLDEATAAAEALTLARRASKVASNRFFVHVDTHPQTIAVMATRAEPLDIELVVGPIDDLTPGEVFGALLSYPTSTGSLTDWRATIAAIRESGAVAVVATDPLACVLLTPPGALGADIAIGSAQRFGVPMGFGGPHAAFMAARESFARTLPGRLVGVSTDAAGRPAFRLALQTREQHIRREKATSNICTAQALLANMAGFYASWHGPEGLRRIATRISRLTAIAAKFIAACGAELVHDHCFDTVAFRTSAGSDAVLDRLRSAGFSARRIDDSSVSLTFDECTTIDEVARVVSAVIGKPISGNDVRAADDGGSRVSDSLLRTGTVLDAEVFNSFHTEHEMLRYLRRLSDKDLALDRTMIPLGSCTMKLNATTEMEPIAWPEFADVHPFAPDDETEGYRTLIAEIEQMLVAVTGYDAVSLQPNAGSQGELAGLLAIRAYHRSRGDGSRDVCLIPSSAHGTNAASAVMAGMSVVVVGCDDDGNVDLDDLRAKVGAHPGRGAAAMVTSPSTHGVFEEKIGELCAIVHDAGGQVYVDGANLNALVGIAQPGRFGADVSHLNLHKTFCIPHGGGGPGVGPVGVRAHLAPFLPGHPLAPVGAAPVGPVSAAPHGSAGILPIPWVYIRLMGPQGLRRATEIAIMNANYIARRLAPHFPVLYTGPGGFVAHECIIDIRSLTKSTGVSVDDIAKRLMDHGFHAPTMSFPVAGTLMIEPTESETKAEIDRFCDAMVAIRVEIDDVAEGRIAMDDSPLRHAPHTVADLIGDWDRRYPRSAGSPSLVEGSAYHAPVSRIDAAFGDRNLVCTCEPVSSYA
ncbi:MAG: aminomethyl-transferring glycine dehydrogenase [Actinomycetota bacterium]